MVHTIRHINKAIKICDEQDEDLDNEQHRLDKQREKGKKQEKIAKQKRLNFQRQMVAKQGDTLRDARTYIFSCGAKEWKISQQWESR
jgi:hypothetical protein